MALLSTCPKCGKLHFVEPEQCGCGHKFRGGGGNWADECPRCHEKIKEGCEECPECHLDLKRAMGYRCPKCGKEVGKDDKYCQCGEELIVMTCECPHCRGRVRADSVTCPKCGRRIRGGEPEWVCGRCGSRLAYYGAQCYACGN